MLLVIALLAGAFGSTILTLPPATALSCAAHPDGSPSSIASGTERLVGDPFFDRYDVAIMGKVATITTNETESDDYGATIVTVEVTAVIGDRSTAPRVEVSSPDPGGMAGYPFEVGRTYFIPIQYQGPDGRYNASFVCDPISAIDPMTVDDLVQMAADRGVEVAIPATNVLNDSASHGDDPDDHTPSGDEDEGAAPGPGQRSPGQGGMQPTALTLLVAAAAMVAVGVLLVRRLTSRRIRITPH